MKSIDNDKKIARDSEEKLRKSLETAKLYTLEPKETLKEITQAVLLHPNTSNTVKMAIAQKNHQFYAFCYPSDGLWVKGYISLPENTPNPIPLIILLRGGNRLFCLPHPGEFSAQAGYASIATTYRGGVSEGEDEFGGNDVNDVKNLINFLPVLEKKLHIQFHDTNKYMVGLSRGAMELFLALGRYPDLQIKIKKIVSVTGMLNFIHAIEERSDVKNTMIKDFGFTEDEKGKAWIAWRQPINYIHHLSKNLPILIIQGTQDIRISLKEGYDMRDALLDAGHNVTYIEVKNGDHMLENMPGYIPEIIKWLEK